MIYLSDPLNQVVADDNSLTVARKNTEIILGYISNNNADDFNIMVDVGGVIFLAPYNGVSLLNGNAVNPPPNNNRANWCLTFQYGSSFATSSEQSTIMSFQNFQIEASEKAFLFESIDEDTRVNVTDLYNSQVSVCWFGAVADGTTNCLVPFQRSVACFRKDNNELSNTVFIPEMSDEGEEYRLDSQLVIDRTVKLTSSNIVNATLRFPNQGGLRVDAPSCTFSNLNILGPVLIEYEDFTHHGVTVSQLIYMERVNISRFDGDGLHIISSDGNTNTSRFYNMIISLNGRNGVYIRGANTNAMLFSGIDIRDNRACGIRDQSRLGNTYIGCHSSNNGNNIGNRSRVVHDGQYYACILDNIGIEPGEDADWEDFWLLVGPPTGTPPNFYTSWNNTSTYVAAASFYNIGEQDNSTSGTSTSRSVFVGCYSESDITTANPNLISSELPIIINIGSLVFGGFSTGTAYKIKSNTGIIKNFNGIVETNDFMVRTGESNVDENPFYQLRSPNSNDSNGNNHGGLRISVNIDSENRVLNYSYLNSYKSFGTQIKKGSIGMMFAIDKSFESRPDFFGTRATNETSNYPTLMQPLFIKLLERTYANLFGYSRLNPEGIATALNPKFRKGDIFLFSDATGTISKKQLGWRCINSSSTTYPNGQWEELHYFEPAQPSADSATNPGIDYSQVEVQGILTELRDLKEKLRDAGILKE